MRRGRALDLLTALRWALLVALLVLDFSAEAAAPYICFVTVPYLSHLVPALRLAEELAGRGLRVAVATVELLWTSLQPSTRSVLVDALANSLAASRPVPETVEVLLQLRRSMISGLLPHLHDDRPDLMIVDRLALAGFDLAEQLGVPFVVLDPLPSLSAPRSHPAASRAPPSSSNAEDAPESPSVAARTWRWLQALLLLDPTAPLCDGAPGLSIPSSSSSSSSFSFFQSAPAPAHAPAFARPLAPLPASDAWSDSVLQASLMRQWRVARRADGMDPSLPAPVFVLAGGLVPSTANPVDSLFPFDATAERLPVGPLHPARSPALPGDLAAWMQGGGPFHVRTVVVLTALADSTPGQAASPSTSGTSCSSSFPSSSPSSSSPSTSCSPDSSSASSSQAATMTTKTTTTLASLWSLLAPLTSSAAGRTTRLRVLWLDSTVEEPPMDAISPAWTTMTLDDSARFLSRATALALPALVFATTHAAIVSSDGCGFLSEALAAGVPALVLPGSQVEAFCAAQAASVGAAVVLGGDADSDEARAQSFLALVAAEDYSTDSNASNAPSMSAGTPSMTSEGTSTTLTTSTSTRPSASTPASAAPTAPTRATPAFAAMQQSARRLGALAEGFGGRSRAADWIETLLSVGVNEWVSTRPLRDGQDVRRRSFDPASPDALTQSAVETSRAGLDRAWFAWASLVLYAFLVSAFLAALPPAFVAHVAARLSLRPGHLCPRCPRLCGGGGTGGLSHNASHVSQQHTGESATRAGEEKEGPFGPNDPRLVRLHALAAATIGSGSGASGGRGLAGALANGSEGPASGAPSVDWAEDAPVEKTS